MLYVPGAAPAFPSSGGVVSRGPHPSGADGALYLHTHASPGSTDGTYAVAVRGGRSTPLIVRRVELRSDVVLLLSIAADFKVCLVYKDPARFEGGTAVRTERAW